MTTTTVAEQQILAERMLGRFRGRDGIHAEQNGKGFKPAHSAIDLARMQDHLAGRSCKGFYLVCPDDAVWCVAADFDNKEKSPDPLWKEKAERLADHLSKLGLTPLVEISQSGIAAHVWIFFSEPIPAWLVRRFMHSAMKQAGAVAKEIYPKQDSVSDTPKGIGNLLRFPLWRKSCFVDPFDDWRILDPIEALDSVELIDRAKLEEMCLTIGADLVEPAPSEQPSHEAKNGTGATIIEPRVSERVEALIANHPNLAARWKGKTDGLEDQSQSGVMFSVASILLRQEISESEVADALLAWACKHAYAKGKSPRRIHLAIRNAKATLAEKIEYRLTDLGNAQRLVHRHGVDLRYCHPWGKWLCWDGKRWRLDDTGLATRRAKNTARNILQEAVDCTDNDDRRKALIKWAAASERAERVRAMLSMGQSEPGIPILPDDLDRDPWLLNVANGTLDLRTGELRDHRRDDFITKLSPVEYSAEASCPIWLEFLHRIFAGDQTLIQFVRRLAGYALTGIVRDHVLPIFYGVGANGKSTLLDTLIALLGADYSMKAPSDLLMTKHNESHPTERADLFGKRLVVVNETDDGRRLNEALVKDLTGGDRQRARRMREDFWEFQATHKIVLVTNHKPVVRGTDHAIWRRLRLVPFNVVIPESEQDRQLGEKLRGELPGILRWALDGCLQWQREGLGEPAAIREATNEYQDEENTIKAFIADCCTLDPSVRDQASRIYGVYRCWCQRTGENFMNRNQFSRALVGQNFRKIQNNGIWYEGLAACRPDEVLD